MKNVHGVCSTVKKLTISISISVFVNVRASSLRSSCTVSPLFLLMMHRFFGGLSSLLPFAFVFQIFLYSVHSRVVAVISCVFIVRI